MIDLSSGKTFPASDEELLGSGQGTGSALLREACGWRCRGLEGAKRSTRQRTGAGFRALRAREGGGVLP